MKAIGRARITVWEGGGLWFIEAEPDLGGVPPHAHHAVQLTFRLDGAMTIGTRDEELRNDIVVVDADAEHRFTLGGTAALLFVDPESSVGRAIRHDLLRGRNAAAIEDEQLATEVEALRAAWVSRRAADELRSLGRDLAQRLAGVTRATPTDPRIAGIIAGLGDRLDGPLTLSDVARSTHLSPSRLRHLFVEQTGLPFKSYVLWRRLMRAVETFLEGATLTEAAHAAGFADSAHFSRTCRRMFGLPATALEYI